MKRVLVAAAAFSVIASVAFAATPALDPARVVQDVKVLSSDEFEGRAPATAGEEKTVAYLIQQLKAAGVQPGGDPQAGGGRAWTQDVPLARFRTQGTVNASVTVNGQVQPWTQGEQIAIRASQTGADRLTVKDAPIVFVGYGVKAPERNWDDFKGVDLKGKVALVLVNDPDFETGTGDFGGKAMTYYGRWTYKFEEAARQGAVGFLVIHETAPASYGWATVKNSNTNEIFDVIRKTPLEAHAPLEGWVQRDVTVELMKAAGLDFEALKKQAQTRDFKPVELKGVTFSTDYAIDAQKVVSKNVVGMVPGAKRPGEHVLYTAHWDHLGVGLPDASGDKIYNGAVDNAMGTAMILEIARAFAKGPKPDRSVGFLFVTAEEKGLLGSEYYVVNPLYPLGSTVGVLNLDGGASAPAKNFSTAGDAPLTLQDDLIAVGKSKGRYFSPDQRPEAGSFFRSDHFPFAKEGVPALNAGGGIEYIGRPAGWGLTLREEYTRSHYHKPSDEVRPDWDLSGAVQDLQLYLAVGYRVANAAVLPAWKPGTEFKAKRDAQLAGSK